MSVHIIRRHGGDTHRTGQPGRSLAIASLLMIPMLLVSYVLAYLAGTAVMDAFDLAEGDSLREAGVWGTVAGLLLIVLICVPQIVGIVLGVKARRLGEARLGKVGVVINAAIAAFLMLSSALQFMLM